MRESLKRTRSPVPKPGSGCQSRCICPPRVQDGQSVPEKRSAAASLTGRRSPRDAHPSVQMQAEGEVQPARKKAPRPTAARQKARRLPESASRTQFHANKLVWAMSRKKCTPDLCKSRLRNSKAAEGKIFRDTAKLRRTASRKTAGEQGSKKSAPKGKLRCTEKPHEEGPAASTGTTASKPATTPRQTSIVA